MSALDLVLLYLTLACIGVFWGYGLSVLRGRSQYTHIAFVWYDLWIGAYYNRAKNLFYVVPIPTIVFIFDWGNDSEKGGAR